MSVETTPAAPAALATANLANIVNILGSNVRDESSPQGGRTPLGSSRNVRLASSGQPRRSACSSYVPKSPQLEEIILAEPSCTERFARYFVIVIYLCGLCSLGFFLSIYHVFFWESRMPPVFKGQKKPSPPAFG
ncbi:uncharacterized protein LOC108604916 [Drosophila busckii]|nr:uncharacterized protein LOC108604916 [Drosophila busckii]